MTPPLCLPTYFPPIPLPYPPLTSLHSCSFSSGIFLLLLLRVLSPSSFISVHPSFSHFSLSSFIFSYSISSFSTFSFFFIIFLFLLILLLLLILFYLCSFSFLLIPITSPSLYLSSSVLLFLLLSSRILFVTVFNFFLLFSS